ncbi:trypsin-like peptidase domain-containing protein [Aeoliella sp. SH292]|uniref:trypsin-like peptidase domain-containing protein n=1 Tax=Aeoliella sp. SH292 TaxID=3454464 RepID=UPI003F992587
MTARRKSSLALVLLALASGVAIAFPSRVRGQDTPVPPAALAALGEYQQALADLIAKVEPSVVAISRAPGGGGDQAQAFPAFESNFGAFAPTSRDPFEPCGAGVVIEEKGLILTQYLNVRRGSLHRITTSDGRQLDATVKAADPRSGLAVLEVKTTGIPALEIGDADQLRKGFFVLTVGNPQAILASGQASASWGTVSNIGQRATPTTNLNNTNDEQGLGYATTLHHLGTLIQVDAKLNWGTGGGAVVDLSGKLVGITTVAGTLPGHESPAGYAIPMTSTFRRIVDDLKAGREVEYGLLGLSLIGPERQTDGIAGAVVGRVVPGSAAAKAGIQPDDRLVEVEGKEIATVADLQLHVSSLPPGKPVNVRLYRNGQEMQVPVSLSKYYVPGDKIYTTGLRNWRGLQVDYSTAAPLTSIDQAAMQNLVDPQGCVAVIEVEPGSAADSAGIKPGMFISHVGEKRVASPDEFYEAVAEADDTVNLRFTGTEAAQDTAVPQAPAE